MADHVTVVCRAAYFHLRQLRLITTSLSVDAAMTLVQSFISCHLDYCISLFSGITDSLLGRLQSVQNAAARLVSGTGRCDHITPVFTKLHWLPVRQRVDFKLAPWLTRRFMIQLQPIMSMTGSSSLTSVVAGYDCVISTRVVFHGPTHDSATGALQPLDRGCGTVCQP